MTGEGFVRDEVMLDIGFDEARDRLAKLDRWFPDASDDVYREEIAVLAPIGPPGLRPACPGWPRYVCRAWRPAMSPPGSR